MTCDDYQIAFDQQRAGVTPAVAEDVLAAHIASCDVCKAYVALSEQVAASMTTAISTAPAMPTAEAILARVTADRKRLVRMAIILPLYFLGLAAIVHFVIWRGSTRYVSPGMFVLLAAVVVVAPIAYWRVRTLRHIEHATGGELIERWRRELQRRIRISYLGAALLIAQVTVTQVLLFGATLPRGPAAVSLGALLFIAGVMLFNARQSRRALAELR